MGNMGFLELKNIVTLFHAKLENVICIKYIKIVEKCSRTTTFNPDFKKQMPKLSTSAQAMTFAKYVKYLLRDLTAMTFS